MEKGIDRFFNLHELVSVMMETAADKRGKRHKRNRIGKQAFLPVQQVVTDNRADIVFVNAGAAFHDRRKVMAAFSLACDLGLVRGRDLGIRDNKGRQECMCLFAFAAEYAHDAHADWSCRGFQSAVVVSMNG